MNPSSVSSHKELSQGEINALLTLLCDEDPDVYSVIRDRIISTGPQASAWLKPHALSSDPLLRRRAQSIIREFEGHAADNEFVAFCLRTGEDLPLETGVWLLAKTAYPDINPAGYSALLDDMAAELRIRLAGIDTARQTLRAIRSYLFDELHYAGDEDHEADAESSYMNRVMDRRLGNPIGLCALYLMLGRRLKLPLTGIGLPYHFVCRYQSTSAEIYVDAFRAGAMLTKADCIHFLQENKIGGAIDEHLAPTSPRRMLLRMCANLYYINTRKENAHEATRLKRYMVALSR